jgi:putative membrane protein
VHENVFLQIEIRKPVDCVPNNNRGILDCKSKKIVACDMEKKTVQMRSGSGNIFLNLVVNTLSVFLVAHALKGVHVDDFTTALIVSIIMGLLNITIKPLLILFTLPITLMTFGFFLLVINAIMIFLVAGWVDGFTVDGFWWAVFFSILLSIVNSILFSLGKRNRV